MKTALLFPGQGSQQVGMGRALADEFEVARRVFEEADDALGFKISEICFTGPEDKLKRTEFTQPAILCNSIAVLRSLQADGDLSFDIAAGHSLGEFSALVAVGALTLRDAVYLVHLRGRAMQAAVPEGVGGMAAIMGLDANGVAALCDAIRGDDVCDPANLNGAGQIVIAGHKSAIERAIAEAKAHGAKRAIALKVSAPFHSQLMAPAAEALRAALADIVIHPMSAPVVANVDATENSDSERVRELLVAQVTGAVRWRESVERLVALGVEHAYELGSGKVLRGLCRRIAKGLTVTSIGEPAQVRAQVSSPDAS